MKSRLMEAGFFHAERRTDKPDEISSCFPKFSESAQIAIIFSLTLTTPFIISRFSVQCALILCLTPQHTPDTEDTLP